MTKIIYDKRNKANPQILSFVYFHMIIKKMIKEYGKQWQNTGI
jgi:hypothetical protein